MQNEMSLRAMKESLLAEIKETFRAFTPRQMMPPPPTAPAWSGLMNRHGQCKDGRMVAAACGVPPPPLPPQPHTAPPPPPHTAPPPPPPPPPPSTAATKAQSTAGSHTSSLPTYVPVAKTTFSFSEAVQGLPAGEKSPEPEGRSESSREDDWAYVLKKGAGVPSSQVSDDVGSSVSQRKSYSRSSVVSAAGTFEEKADKGSSREQRLSLINHLHRSAAGEVPQKEVQDPDAMQLIWAGTKNYQEKKEKMTLPLSKLQEEVISRFVLPKNADSAVPYTDSESRSIRVSDEDYKLFRTPSVNQEAIDYVNLKKGGKPKKYLFRDRAAGKMEEALRSTDQAARVGMRMTVYLQWLLTSFKAGLLEALGDEQTVIKEGSRLDSVFNETMEMTTAGIRQFGRVSNISLVNRRKAVLEELNVKEELKEKVKRLPVEPSGKYLFGMGVVDGKPEGLDDIVKGYVAKKEAFNKAKGAFNLPQQQSNRKRQQDSTEGPAPKRQDSGGKDRRFENKRGGGKTGGGGQAKNTQAQSGAKNF